jgi:gliding motility-associated-like protein
MHTGKKSRRYHWVLFLLVIWQYGAKAQGCPVNIGFEKGDFKNWVALVGGVDTTGVSFTISTTPVANQHMLYKKTNSVLVDPYGNFPVTCPNGSGYTLKLGNDKSGAEAEAVHYTFTIPADRNDFSLIYHYAVVMQNPGHAPKEQPKFTAKVFNVTTNQYITCSSFEYIASPDLPGFRQGSLGVLYKNWTPVTIKLSGYAGTTFRLEFGTNDCTRGVHFGYAYVDVDENCLSPVLGNIVCQNDTAFNLTAPYGFSSYKWFNQDFSKIVGTENILKLPTTPPDNTVYAVELTPYPQQGCADTVYSRIHYSTESIDLKVTQAIITDCINEGADITTDLITTGSSPGLIFSYYTDPELTNRYFTPDAIISGGTYYIKATNGDGCSVSKPVVVKLNPLPAFSVTAGSKPVYKPATFDLTTVVSSAGTLSYWQDAEATIPLINPNAIEKNGTYFIKITSAAGCSAITSVTASFVNPPVVLSNVFSPNGDGINDTWEMPAIKYYTENIVEIFSRSGQLLFRSVGYEKSWDGKQNGKELPVGTYYYVIRLTPTDPPIGGSVTIVR